ncbi:MAG: TRAP transporter substrate-binding protein [Planctomycetota bacterium]|nr:TRAP transporter substrate-binding protein [Planctomycetota bacterium]
MLARKLSSVFALVMAIGALAGCENPSAAGEAIVIKIAHVSQQGVPVDRWARKFGETIAERSGGAIAVEVFPNSSLGGNRELLEQLQLGGLEAAISSVAFLGGFTNTTKLLDLPYLFKHNAGAEAVLDGEVGQAMFASLKESGFIGLAWLSTGWRHLTANKEIRSPDGMKGLKIRVMDNPLHIAHFNALGASAIPMAFSEVFTALQQGTIDCQENPYANIQGNRLNEVQKYIIKTGHIYDTSPLLYSQALWDNFSGDQQNLIVKAVADTLAWQRAISAEDELVVENAFKNNGKNVIVELTADERAEFRRIAQKVYDQFQDEIGPELIKKVDAIQAGL